MAVAMGTRSRGVAPMIFYYWSGGGPPARKLTTRTRHFANRQTLFWSMVLVVVMAIAVGTGSRREAPMTFCIIGTGDGPPTRKLTARTRHSFLVNVGRSGTDDFILLELGRTAWAETHCENATLHQNRDPFLVNGDGDGGCDGNKVERSGDDGNKGPFSIPSHPFTPILSPSGVLVIRETG